MYDRQINVVTDTLDQLAVVPHLNTQDEKAELCQHIIDTLADYTKPRKKGEHLTKAEPVQELGAYLYVSNARNSAKLAKLGFELFPVAFVVMQNELEKALSLLTNHKA